MSDRSSFPTRLKQLREQHGLSRDKLSKLVGVDQETLRSWEAGRRKPGKDTVIRLAQALGFRPGTKEFQAFIREARGLPDPTAPLVGDVPATDESGDTLTVKRVPGASLLRSRPIEQRARAKIIREMHSIWIDGVLQYSLHGQALIELGLAERTDLARQIWDDVFPWDLRDRQSGDAELPFPEGALLIDVFDAYQAELLILGAPGAGKTTLLLDLAKTLLDRASDDEDYPIPIILNLASWIEQQLPLADWLVDELSERYGIAPRVSQGWIREDALLPLLDGLDEVRQQDRAACVAALNQFHEQHPCGMVVTSRSADYDELVDHLRIRSAVVLQPLSEAQIAAYIRQFGARLATLDVALGVDDQLRELARLPLLLSMMVVVYQGADEGTIPHGVTLDEQRHELFDRYVIHVFTTRRRSITVYTLDQTRRWLAWLAREMTTRSQTIFYPDRLQYDWLATRTSRIAYGLIDRMAGAALGALALGCSYLLLIIGYGLLAAEPQIYYRYLGYDTAVMSLIGAIIGGIFGGLPSPTEGRATGLRGGLGWLIGGLYLGVVGWSVAHSIAGVISYGIIGCAIGAFSGRPNLQPRLINTIEPRRWSWQRTRGLLPVLVSGGIAAGWLMGLLVGRIDGIFGRFFTPLIGSTIAGGLAGVLSAFAFGISRTDVAEQTTRPNQAIYRSARGAGWAALEGGVVAGVIFTLVAAVPVSGILTALMGALIGGAAFGGYTVVSHYVVRLMLWSVGLLPLRLLFFLSLCSERILLQRIGGGYRFIHKLLQEYFATRPATRQPMAIAGTPVAPIHLPHWAEIIGLCMLLLLFALCLSSNPHRTSLGIVAPREQASLVLASGAGYIGRTTYNRLIEAGSAVRVSVGGGMEIGPFTGTVDPEGVERGFYGLPLGNVHKVIADFPTGALLCRIIGEPAWRLCAPQTEFMAPHTGQIEFLINDKDVASHNGSFIIQIDVEP